MVSGTESDISHPEAADTATAAGWVVVAELEPVMVATRHLLVDAVSEALAGHNLTLDRALFRRCCLGARSEAIAARLAAALPDAGLDPDALAGAIDTAYHAKLTNGSAKVSETFQQVLKAMGNTPVRIAALTSLPEDVATAVLTSVGLAAQGVRLHVEPDPDPGFPGPDAWLKVCRSESKSVRSCIAVTATQDACKAALAAGMRCVAVPDDDTAHHDFGGADAVLEGDDEDLKAFVDAIL